MPVFRYSEQELIPMFDNTLMRRNLARGGKLMMIEVEIPKGSLAPPHSHAHEQATYLLEGSAEARVGAERFVLKPGDSIFIASGVEHAVHALEDCRLLDVFSPQREDLLK